MQRYKTAGVDVAFFLISVQGITMSLVLVERAI
jgi:hypothetical protein